jgi:hypothetical protein
MKKKKKKKKKKIYREAAPKRSPFPLPPKPSLNPLIGKILKKKV